MQIWTAFLLGLVGSIHCAGMCGPLALALPGANGSSRMPFVLGRLGYNLGRISSYALIGLVFGMVGQTVALAGFQRWLSLSTGVLVLLAWMPVSRRGLSLPAIRAVTAIKSGLGLLLKKRSWPALYLLGLLNGILPCGLVYVAGAGALAAGSVLGGIASMVAFGLGTVPLMLGIGLLGRNLQVGLRFRLQRLIPACVLLIGALLVLRGLALGIPYLSPTLEGGHVHSCH